MSEEQPSKTSGAKKRDMDSPTGQTPDDPRNLALGYDPGRSLVRRKAVTAPLKPLQRTLQQQGRSPVLLVVGALVILGMIVLAVMFSASGGSDFSPPDSVIDSTCTIRVDSDTNVRLGPGYEYQRGWILDAGQSRLADARSGENWFRITNGWVSRDDVLLTTEESCTSLQEFSSPQIFSDELVLPAEVEVLRWSELFGESFATGANGWVESASDSGAALVEGMLILSTIDHQPETLLTVSPQFSPNYQPLHDAFYTFDLSWISGASGSEVIFTFAKSENAAFQVVVRRDGMVKLMDMDGTELAQADSVISGSGRQIIGVLYRDREVNVFLNGQQVSSVTVDDSPSGVYTFALRGANAEVSINRFVVKIPAAN